MEKWGPGHSFVGKKSWIFFLGFLDEALFPGNRGTRAFFSLYWPCPFLMVCI